MTTTTTPASRGLTEAERRFAVALEARLRPALAAVTSAAGGGADSHGHPVPGLPERLARLSRDLLFARTEQLGPLRRGDPLPSPPRRQVHRMVRSLRRVPPAAGPP